ncbi:MAG: hypothetical protein H8D45_30280 [Bacteroidetes bacterium]|nr:hypothetical protein [Bacteroidota bacterium]MBL7105131.1 hypothetical protein [Bacteroidales bacterium]
MGITIHYKGTLDKVEKIEDFVNEITDISKEMGWEYDIINTEPEKNKPAINGIIIKPHEKSESLSLFFDTEGRIQNIASLIFENIDDDGPPIASIKTQYAPLDIHIAIIKLLKYIKSKYISDLYVFDEGDYWKSMDENILREKMEFLASRIELLGDVLDSHSEEFGKTKSVEQLADKIEEVLKKFGFERND